MSVQTTPITERQLDLITRAHCDAGGLIEPLLTLKGGAKLKMIASLAQRGATMRYIPCLNDTPAHARALAALATQPG